MVATASTFDPLWAFVLGDYDEYRDDEATAKPKYESREPEPEPKQQDRAEQEQATVTSRAAIPKAAKSRLEQKRDAMDKKSKRKLGTRSMHSKAPGSKASESKGSVARSKVAEARSSQSKLSQNSKASQAKASKRKPLETIDDSKSYASEEQEYEAKTTLKLDYLVTKELHAPTKSANKGVTGLTGSKKSIFGWIRKKHRKVRRGVYNAIVERSKVSEARKLGMSMNSKAPKSKASESKSSVPRSKVSETRKLGMPMHSKAPGSKASELKSSVAASKASKEMSSQLLEEGTAQEPIRESYSDVKDAKETLLRYANKVGDYMEDILNGMEKESKMKLGMPMQSKAPGSKASESKSSVAGSKASEATSSQTELAQNSEASQAKATERKPLETIDDSKSTVTAEQESVAKAMEKPDSADGLTGSKKSKFGWITKENRKAKPGENSAIRIQSVVRGVVGREMARVERRKHIAIRLQSLHRGVIAPDLVKLIKAKETYAVRIQREARGRIVRNQVRTNNTAATRIQSNHRGHVVRKRQNMDKQKVLRDRTTDESESHFDKFFVMSCYTGWGATKSVEADLSKITRTATTEGPITTEPAYDELYATQLSTILEEEVDSDENHPSEGATGLTGSERSTFAKREENSAIRIQSVVRGAIGREMAKAERRKQIAIRLQSLRGGDIAPDMMNSIGAKETSAVRIQSVARGSIVRNQVQTDNTAATRIQSNHRGHVVRKRQNMDKQKMKQDRTSYEGESFFDKFFVMSCCTGWGKTKRVEADLFETPRTAITTDGSVTN